MGLFRKKKPVKASAEGGSNLSAGQRYNMIREEENRRYLAELLARPRPESVKHRLEPVLAGERDLKKKIQILEDLDKHGVETLGPHESHLRMMAAAASQKRAKPAIVYHFEAPDALRVNQNPQAVRAALPGGRGPLGDYRRIRRFALATRLLDSHFFRLRHDFSEVLLHYWNIELKVILRFLEEPLRLMVEDSWKQIAPVQYNLISLLYSMAICYRENELIFLDSRPDADAFRRLLPFLTTFLRLVHHPEYKEQLLDTMMQYMQQIRYLAPINRRVVMAASRLFQGGQASTPGLKNSLLALHMAFTRRYASLEDLQALYRVEAVPNDRYLMDSTIQERLQKYLGTIREEMSKLSGSLSAFTEIRVDKPDLMEEVACHDLFSLQQGEPHPVVEQGKTAAQMARALLQYDLVAFMEKAVSGFVYQVEPLLTGRIAGPAGPIHPFDAHLFSGDLEKISTLLENLRNYRTKFNKLTLTYDFYKNFLNSPDRIGSFSDAERSICLAFRALGGHLYQLALKLNAMLTRDAGLASDDPDDGKTARLIRHEAVVVPAPGFFAGKTVKMALHAVVQIAVGAALLLGEPTLQAFLSRYPAMLERIDELRRVLSRFPGMS